MSRAHRYPPPPGGRGGNPRQPISIPLPLPIQFGLLPSRIPGKTLCPVLYSVVNSIPVYLVLSPKQEPHFSLLPLILSLSPPVPPLHILTTVNIMKHEYSVDLDGLAPFIDIWVNWTVARKIVERLRISKLFYDENDLSKGLLSHRVREAYSWDEMNVIGHNWKPPQAILPASCYSLATLLEVPFPYIEIIPDSRYISTTIDRGRRASIESDFLDFDFSGIRYEAWDKGWEVLVRWTIHAWEEFAKFPSQPPRVSLKKASPTARFLHELYPLLPQMCASGEQLAMPSFVPVLSDLHKVLNPPPATQHNSRSLFERLLPDTSAIKMYLSPLNRVRLPDMSHEELMRKEMEVRMNLSMVDSVGTIMVMAWWNEKQREKLKAMVENRPDLIPKMVINAVVGDLPNDSDRPISPPITPAQPHSALPDLRPKRTSPDPASARRGSSVRFSATPAPSATPDQAEDQTEWREMPRRADGLREIGAFYFMMTGSWPPWVELDSRGNPIPPPPPSPPRPPTPPSPPTPQADTPPRWPQPPEALSSLPKAIEKRIAAVSPAPQIAEAATTVTTVTKSAARAGKRAVRQMKSEDPDGWSMYVYVFASIVVALFLGSFT